MFVFRKVNVSVRERRRRRDKGTGRYNGQRVRNKVWVRVKIREWDSV